MIPTLIGAIFDGACLVLSGEMIMKHSSDGPSLRNLIVYTHSSIFKIDLPGGGLIEGIFTFVSVVIIAYLLWKYIHCCIHLRGAYGAWHRHQDSLKKENSIVGLETASNKWLP